MTVFPVKSTISVKPSHSTLTSKKMKRGGLNWQGLSTSSSSTPDQATETPQGAPALSPNINFVDDFSSSGSCTRKRLRSPSADTMTLVPRKPLTSNDHIIFHFFLSDPNLGAIPWPASNCNTSSDHFEAACAASIITASSIPLEPRIVGVTVSWDGANRPIFILWGDTEGFQNMMLTVTEAKHAEDGKLDVEIRCIVRE